MAALMLFRCILLWVRIFLTLDVFLTLNAQVLSDVDLLGVK
jgi:hypothetical protein